MALSFLLRGLKKFPKQKVLNLTKKEEFTNILKNIEKQNPEDYKEVNQNLVYTFSKLLNGEDVKNTLKSLETSQSVEELMFLCHLYLDGKIIKKDETETRNILKRLFELDPNYASKYASDIYFNLKDFEECQKYLSYSENKNFYNGYFYYSGIGYKKDIKRAVEYFQKDENHPKSLYFLGLIYNFGLIDSKKDYTKAFEYFKKSYELAEKSSISFLGKMYSIGRGCEKDVEKGTEILKENESDPYCSFALGRNYFEKDNEKSFNYFSYAFQNGNKTSALYLGIFYLTPIPPVKESDYQKAKIFFEVNQNGNSYYYLGVMNFKGYGVDKDYKKAFEYFEKSYKLGEMNSISYLVKMLLQGLGCQKNIPLAIEYLEKGTMIFREKKEDLGIYYLYGQHVKKDENKGLSILKELDSNKSHFHLGTYYFNNNNYEKSLEHFNKLKNKGEKIELMISIMKETQGELNGEELYNLGLNYEMGKLIEKDLTKSFEYFKKSFEKGYTKANLKLGIKLIKGEGCKRETIKGLEILEKLEDNIGINFLLEQYAKIDENYKNEKELEKDLFFIGKYYFQKNDYEKSLEFLNRVKNKSQELESMIRIMNENQRELNGKELYDLATEYLIGKKVEKNFKKSFEYIQKSFEKGYSKAVIQLGSMLIKGEGCERDIPKGIEILEKSQDSDSLFTLGLFYYNGSIELNYEKSFEYFKKSLEKGNTKASNYLGAFYSKGLPPIIKPDYLKAIEYYEMDENNPISIKQLGFIHFNHTKNYSKALKYFTKSLQLKEDFTVYSLLSKMYHEGLGVEKNQKISEEYLEKYLEKYKTKI